MKAPLLTTCVMLTQRDVPQLWAMMDIAREIQFQAFAKRCDWQPLAKAMEYDIGRGERGLHLRDDYAVRFYRSKWNKRPCYVMQHSAIEYIFQLPKGQS